MNDLGTFPEESTEHTHVQFQTDQIKCLKIMGSKSIIHTQIAQDKY